MQNNITITAELPKNPIGTKFIYRYGKQKYDAEVIGYHIEHNTDTGNIDVTYRAKYDFAGLQIMIVTVARSTVDMAIMTQEQYTKQIPCPEHAQDNHKATLYTYGHKFAGIWECPFTGSSDICEHESKHVETTQVDYFPTPDIDASYDVEFYQCDACKCEVDGNPTEDRAEALAEQQIMETLDK